MLGEMPSWVSSIVIRNKLADLNIKSTDDIILRLEDDLSNTWVHKTYWEVSMIQIWKLIIMIQKLPLISILRTKAKYEVFLRELYAVSEH